MTKYKALPRATRFEGTLAQIGVLKLLIDKVHQQRKKFYVARNRLRDARSASNLRNFERKVHSQYGEDGILEEIFRRIGEKSRFAVEFGIETGSECNTRLLIEDRGWSAVLIDGSAEYVSVARGLFAGRPVRVLNRFLTTQNILAVFAETEVPREFDLLSIDVDGNDFWLWEEILSFHRPRVVVIEYNGRWLPPTQWVMPYDPSHSWNGSVYYGASLQSLTDLGERCGYKLVCCSSTGLNAFFVREDEVGDHFPTSDLGARYHFAAPLYNYGFGHPVLPPKIRKPVPADPISVEPAALVSECH